MRNGKGITVRFFHDKEQHREIPDPNSDLHEQERKQDGLHNPVSKHFRSSYHGYLPFLSIIKIGEMITEKIE